MFQYCVHVVRVLCSCCVDYVAAKHVDADAVIHFGHTCLSSSGGEEIPTLYVFPKEHLDVKSVTSSLIDLVNNSPSNFVLLYDVSYSHYVGKNRTITPNYV